MQPVLLSARGRRRSDIGRASGASLRCPWGREPQASGGRYMKIFGVDLGPIKPKKPRSPRRYFGEITRGQALFPLVILFGLHAVERQLDQTALCGRSRPTSSAPSGCRPRASARSSVSPRSLR